LRRDGKMNSICGGEKLRGSLNQENLYENEIGEKRSEAKRGIKKKIQILLGAGKEKFQTV